MLRELKIENLAIIENLNLEFDDGLIILTGETGAGKSIILTGINLLIGEKFNAEMLQKDKKLVAEGVFEVSEEFEQIILENEIEIQDRELIIRREISAAGRSKIFLNGQRKTLLEVKKIMKHGIDLIGQHSNQVLLNKNNHVKLLDKFLTKENEKLKSEIHEIASRYFEIEGEIDKLYNLKKEYQEKRDFYSYQLEEIEKHIVPEGEDKILEEEYKILFNAGKIKEVLEGSVFSLRENEENILSKIHTIRKNIESIKNYNEEFEEIFTNIDRIYYDLEELSFSIQNSNENVENNDFKLEEIIKKLDGISKLKSKYGETLEDIGKFRDELSDKLNLLENFDYEISDLEKERLKLEDKYWQKTKILTKNRMKKAKELEKRLYDELCFLNMNEAEFKIEINSKDKISVDGNDDIEFYISTNKGQDLKPLSKIVSGGEISRIMLALKSIFAEVDKVPILIFDEIDTGVGGETVRKVADKLKELSGKAQLICISHSSTIAAKANQHFYIEKKNSKSKTISTVTQLSETERVEEISRMIAGKNITEAVIKHSKELLGVL